MIPVSKMDLDNNLNADVPHISDTQLVPTTDPSGASAQDHRQVAVKALLPSLRGSYGAVTCIGSVTVACFQSMINSIKVTAMK